MKDVNHTVKLKDDADDNRYRNIGIVVIMFDDNVYLVIFIIIFVYYE